MQSSDTSAPFGDADTPDHDMDQDLERYCETVAANAAALREELVAAGFGDCTVLGVTKGHPVEVLQAARRAGMHRLGENYAQELIAKASTDDGPDIEWHFIGQLQSNKVKQLSRYVGRWQTLDRPSIVRAVAQATTAARGFIQVNLAGAEHRGGCMPNEVEGLLDLSRDLGLHIDGLMGVASFAEASRVEYEFTSLVRLADELELPERCIGMSGDYRMALECGSTMIRVGQRIFGERHPRQPRI